MVTALSPVMDAIPGLQVYPGMPDVVTPPAIDIYPDPAGFQVGAGFGVGEKLVYWIVRARVSTADMRAANALLLRLLDTEDVASVEAALADVAVVGNDGIVSGFTVYSDDPEAGLMGCQWRVEMFV